jgi:hypothetical protein
MNKKLKKQNLN